MSMTYGPRFNRCKVSVGLALVVWLGWTTVVDAQSTRFFTGATNARWANSGNWSPAGQPLYGDDLVFGFTGFRTQANDDFTSGATNFNSLTYTNPYTLGVQNATVKLMLGAGGIVVERQVTGGNCVYRILTLLDGDRTVINNSTNSLLNFTLASDYTTVGQFVGVDNQGFLLTIAGAGSTLFQAASGIIGSGGLMKTGTGALTLNSTNTYTGPTTVAQGRLALGANHIGGGSVSVNNAATFSTFVVSPGRTFRCSALNLGDTPGGAITNEFALGSLGNPTAPVAYATNLTTTGTVYVNVTGGGLAVGQFTLLQYGTLGGAGFTFVSNSLPGGVVGYLSNNIANSSLDLVVTFVPSLRWTGQTNAVIVSNWDINGTSNWVDSVTGTPTFFVNGVSVDFDDTAATKTVTLSTNVAPFDLKVTTAGTYTLTNSAITNRLTGTARITKDGAGTLVLGVSTNSYSGFTSIKAGVLRLAAHQVIGDFSSVTNEGTLDLAGFEESINGLSGAGVVTNSAAATNLLTVGAGAGSGNFSGRILEGLGRLSLSKASSGVQKLSGDNHYSGGTFIATLGGFIQLGNDNVLGTGPVTMTSSGGLTPDASPRLLTNDMYFNGQSVFGSPGAGLLTLSGNIIFTNSGTGDRNMTCHSDVLWSGATISSTMPGTGFGDKLGVGTLTLKNISGSMSNFNPMVIGDGAVMLDGAVIDLDAGLRVRTVVTNGFCALVISNNSSLTIISSNMRIGDQPNGAPEATNRVDVIGGTLNVLGGVINMGYNSLRSILNVKNGTLELQSIGHGSSTGPSSTSEINFDAAIVKPRQNSGDFLSGLQEVYIHNGGLKFDTLGFNITVAQDLLAGTGSGGLTKSGAGRLILSGINSYIGATVAEGGIFRVNGALGPGAVSIKSGVVLEGVGTIGGPVTVESGATLEPGENEVGTLTINNTVAQQGTTVMQLNRELVPNSDQIVSSGTITYGGTLTVTNSGSTLQPGDTFQLFSAAALAGSFSPVNLPTIYVWSNSLAVDGKIQVLSVVPPGLSHGVSGGNLNLSWPGGYLGWVLESQTNALNVGLTNEWFAVPGSETVNSLEIAIDPSSPTVFYRLRSP